ncbi:MAG: GNAT family N-acetyltransferase [Phycisphaeraceae bacterium]|nr:GNAT family N-acetyltransferase [Phycisphaeraceae bacterium]
MNDDAAGAAMVLTTERLILRPIGPGDRAAWIEADLENAGHWAPWAPALPPDLSPDERFERALERTHAGLARGDSYRFAAFERSAGGEASPRIAGFCSLNNVVRGVFLNADLGYMIARRHEGRGLAYELCARVLDYAFGPEPTGLGLHRVQANVIPGNERSLRLAARLGMRREGLGVAMLKIAGRWQDHVMNAILAEEWHARRPRPR